MNVFKAQQEPQGTVMHFQMSKEKKNKNNVLMALHLKHLQTGGSGFSWVENTGMQSHTLHCWDPAS